uniref:Uncharacterized protein n=1 Tax=Anguilla anguilla TaxID=7936 RepID=A0A0E9Q7S2_ANGAN
MVNMEKECPRMLEEKKLLEEVDRVESQRLERL